MLSSCFFLAACGGGDDDGGASTDDAAPPQPDAGLADASVTADAADTGDAGPGEDASPVMSITEVIPSAASRTVETEITVLGYNLEDGAELLLTNCDDASITYDLTSTAVVADEGRSLRAVLGADDTRAQGLYTVRVTNPNQQSDELSCAFRVLAQDPPSVTEVVADQAYRGMSGDGINSDSVVTITGEGFRSTPNVRFVKTDATASYDALFVGFNSETQLTATVPSETLAMTPGEYHVYVVNPSLLSGQWLVPDGNGGTVAGVFTVTETPPPDIFDVAPARIDGDVCTTTTMVISGSGFDADASDGATSTAWYMTEGTGCAGAIFDQSGNELCPLTTNVVDGTTIEALFPACPNQGAYPLRVINPDDQFDTFYNIERRPSNDGHLSADPFETSPMTLETARFKHASSFGFDAFGNAYIYLTGGEDASGLVLDSTELTQLDVFGNLSPFATSMQYLAPDTPRVVNTLTTPRQGATMARLGRTLYVVGGADTSTDVLGTVTALQTMERARILSYYEMPAIQQPQKEGGSGLPVGSWYYRVSAVGDWGESLASREVIAFNSGGTVRVCWNPPEAGDTGRYNVYRSLASDGRAGSAAAIAYEVSGPCFEDTGVGVLTPAPGNLRGGPAPNLGGSGLGEGTHTYRVSAVVDDGAGSPYETYAGYEAPIEITAADVTAGNDSVDLRWDPIAGATYDVYRLDTDGTFLRIATGLTDATLVDDGLAFESPAVSPRAEVESLPPGSLSYWDDTNLPMLNEPREGLDGLVIETDPTDTLTLGIVGRLLVAGGRAQNAAGTYHTSAESLAIYEDGSLGASWLVEAAEFTSARAFFALVTTQGRNETPVPPPPEEPPCGDLDGDGLLSCDCGGTDCNDADPSVYPGAPEICGDGIDQDCDMGCSGEDLMCECTDDVDMDGHISLDCGGDDCNDADPTIHPDAPEVCGDGIDQDCDGVDPDCECDTDADNDGYVSWECGGGDCCDVGTDTSLGCTDDTADGIYPGAVDVCSNGIDEDCDGGEPICRISVTEPYRSTGAMSTGLTSTISAARRSPIARAATPVAAPARYAIGSVGSSTQPLYALVGDEPVYVVAVAGDDDYVASNNGGRSDIEACLVGDDGHLACGVQWAVQAGTTQQPGFGIDAVLYFQYLYSLRGVSRETIEPLSRQLNGGNISRFPVTDPSTATNDQVIGGFQSANTSTSVARGYHETLRLLSYIYVVGGWTATGTDGVTPGPTGTVEKHLQ